MKVYGALEVAQLEWFTNAAKPTASSYQYRVIYVSDLKQVQVSDGTNWIPFLNTSTNQTISGDITFSGQQIFNGLHRLSVTTNSSTGAITALAPTTPITEFTGAVTSVSGITSGASGATVMLINRSGSPFTVLDEDAGATAANRIRTGTGASITLTNNASIMLSYAGDSRWHVVGGTGSASAGGAKNYFVTSSANSNFSQNSVSPWSACTLTLSSGVPTGAPTLSATRFSIAANPTNPLIASQSNYNLQLTKTAFAAQGQGFISGPLTIDREDLAKVLTGSFSYEVVSGTVDFSGTSTQSLEIWVYNTVNGAWTQPAGYRGINQSLGQGIVTFTFQTDSASANNQYRIAVITAQSDTNSYVVNFNDFKIGPQTAPIGPVVTDWVSYTPTGSWTTNTTYTGKWRRVGDSMEIEGVVSLSGAPNAAGLSVNLPSGFTIDINKLLTATWTSIGTAQATGGVSTATALQVTYSSTTSFSFLAITNGTTSAQSAVSNTIPFTWASGNAVQFLVQVPIVGWSSTTQMSNDTDTRVVAASLSNGTSVAALGTSDVLCPFSNIVDDTHGAWSTSTNNYTIPVSGRYKITFQPLYQITTAGASCQINSVIKIDGTTIATTRSPLITTAIFLQNPCVYEANFRAGQTIGFYASFTSAGSSGNFYNDSVYSKAFIERLSGPSVIAATETVACEYNSTAGQSIPTLIDSVSIQLTNKQFDTHGMYITGSGYNGTTGTWTIPPAIQIPVSGKYQISFSSGIALGASNIAAEGWAQIQQYRGGSLVNTISGPRLAGSFSSTFSSTGGAVINCLAGDQIYLQQYQSTGSAKNTSTEARFVYISVVRVGN